jgi:glutathione S-transferase
MTDEATPKSLQREVLELTLMQHRIKRAIDLRRAKLDELARAELQATGAAPQWKIRDRGTIRLDGADAPPKAYVRDSAAFASYIAERFPHEATATITLDSAALAAALEALEFAGIKHNGAKAAVRPAFQTVYLDGLLLDKDAEEDENGKRPYVAIDPETAEVVPGIGGDVSSPTLKVIADPAAKKTAEREVEDEYRDQLAALETPAVTTGDQPDVIKTEEA